jgi:hypothetical protein
MKKIFGERLHLLYTDTDSFVYSIESENLYKELVPFAQKYFDFSNYPKDHFLYSSSNKRVPGMFKDELASGVADTFIALRSKMYCIKINGKNIKTAKGVKKSVVEQSLHFEDYLNCLMNNVQTEHYFKSINSRAHSVKTFHQKKISLSPFDDKRYLLNGVESVPYGFEG